VAKTKIPMTPALRVLKENNVSFEPREYRYLEHGGTRVAAEELGVDEHTVIKTLVFEDEKGSPLIVLMHGDREVSTKSLARALGVKSITACDPRAANKHTGYQVGGISPFGTRTGLPVFVEDSILGLPLIRINGGRRGLLVEMSPADLARLLKPTPVQAAR